MKKIIRGKTICSCSLGAYSPGEGEMVYNKQISQLSDRKCFVKSSDLKSVTQFTRTGNQWPMYECPPKPEVRHNTYIRCSSRCRT